MFHRGSRKLRADTLVGGHFHVRLNLPVRLEHYRLFRHHFVVRTFDLVVNFAFLFGIAILPYAVQTFLRFEMLLLPFSLYLGDLILLLVTHSILRMRGLRQRRADPDEAGAASQERRGHCVFGGNVPAGRRFPNRPG